MPYAIKKVGNRYATVKKDDNKVMGRHPSRESAQKQIEAIYANESRSSGADKK